MMYESLNLKAWRVQFNAKPTGFSVVPQRYPSPRPDEYVVAPRDVPAARKALLLADPKMDVHVDEYVGRNAMCIYGGKLAGDRATLEEALLHIYRYAPREDFALALQASLTKQPTLRWFWLRRQPEWPELAGIFVGVNELLGRPVFPKFRVREWPDVSQDQLYTVAQAFIAHRR